MKDIHTIAAQSSIVFCIFVAFYHYQVQALDVDKAAACVEHSQISGKEIHLPLLSNNGSLYRITCRLNSTVLDMEKEVEKVVGIPPGQQIFSHMGSRYFFDWAPGTVLADIKDLERLAKDSHILIIERKYWDISTFDALLQDFLESIGRDPSIIRFLKEKNITQYEKLREITEQECIAAGLKVITRRKFLEAHHEHLEKGKS